MSDNIEENSYHINIEESKRIEILKLWFSIMVVFIHSNRYGIHFTVGNVNLSTPLWLENFKYLISNVISSCAVPFFFFLSSIFLYRKPFSWSENLKKKLKTLLLPYFILNTFWIIFFFVFQRVGVLSQFFSQPGNIVANWEIMDWIEAYTGFIRGTPILYPLWFLRDLFMLNILAFFFKKVADKFPKLFFVFLIAFWLFIDSTHCFFLDIRGVCFWGWGYLFVKHRIHLSSLDKISRGGIALLYITLITIDVYLKWVMLHRLCILLGGVFWYVCGTKFSNINIRQQLLLLSKFSFDIYIFHEMNLTILLKLCTKVLPTSGLFQLLVYFFIPAFIIFGCCVLSLLMRRVMSYAYVIITGNRV